MSLSAAAVVLALALSATAQEQGASGGCIHDDLVYEVGHWIQRPEFCTALTCQEGNVWVNETCPGSLWNLEGDFTQDYPDCCPRALSFTEFFDSLDEELTANVTYGGDITVDKGNELTASQVQNEPAVSWPIDPDGVYLLMMFSIAAGDTDGSSADFHWVAFIVPGSDKGYDLSEYEPPTVAGRHYIFYVMEAETLRSVFELEEVISSKDFLQKAQIVAVNAFTLVE